MKDVTVHILASTQNEKLIQKTINSIQTPYLLEKATYNRHLARNEMTKKSKTTWNLALNPGEIILEWTEPLGNTLYCQVLENNIITKEVRLWRTATFYNPVFESTPSNTFSDIIISGYTEPVNKLLIEKWAKEAPLDPNPYYYLALAELNEKNYKQFIFLAEKYIFNNKDIIKECMLKYYLAMVNIINKDYQKGIEYLSDCLSENILMAEFWCLLGDIYLTLNDARAKEFYENALILGNKRLFDDEWPLHIPKYQEYPEKMLKLFPK